MDEPLRKVWAVMDAPGGQADGAVHARDGDPAAGVWGGRRPRHTPYSPPVHSVTTTVSVTATLSQGAHGNDAAPTSQVWIGLREWSVGIRVGQADDDLGSGVIDSGPTSSWLRGSRELCGGLASSQAW